MLARSIGLALAVLVIALVIVADFAHSLSQSRNGVRPWAVVSQALTTHCSAVAASPAISNASRNRPSHSSGKQGNNSKTARPENAPGRVRFFA